MIDLSVFGVDTQTAVAIFLTVALSEVVKKTVDEFNLAFEKSLFKHWHILMPIILSSVASLVINLDYLTLAGYLKSWAYIFAFSVVLYETIVRRIKSRTQKFQEETPAKEYPPYVTPPAQESPRTPCDIIYPSDGGK